MQFFYSSKNAPVQILNYFFPALS